MKAIRFERYGEPADVLSVEERDVPTPAAGQALVRVLASPVNPSDLLYVRGRYSGVAPRFPSGVGFEGAGIVEELGDDAAGVAVGQRVCVPNGPGGNWAGYAAVDAAGLVPVPDELDDDLAATAFINPATAVLMVRHVLGVPRGEWLLQSAAGSELGRMIIRLARREGIRTINVVRRREAADELLALGADAVVVSTDGPIDAQVRAVTGTDGVGYAIDPVVGSTGTGMFASLRADGHMLVYGSLTDEPLEIGGDARLILSGRRRLEVFWLGYWLPHLDRLGLDTAGADPRRRIVAEIADLIRDGVLATSAVQRFGLDDVHRAVAAAESGARRGKVLLVPGEDPR